MSPSLAGHLEHDAGVVVEARREARVEHHRRPWATARSSAAACVRTVEQRRFEVDAGLAGHLRRCWSRARCGGVGDGEVVDQQLHQLGAGWARRRAPAFRCSGRRSPRAGASRRGCRPADSMLSVTISTMVSRASGAAPAAVLLGVGQPVHQALHAPSGWPKRWRMRACHCGEMPMRGEERLRTGRRRRGGSSGAVMS